ncbi:MAG: HAMP domain-containing sensor histidine kinase [Dehalococcoidia bacterium]
MLEQERVARAEAEAAARVKDEFLAVAAHELRTPVTTIKGYAQLLNRRITDAGDPRLRPTLEIIDQAANRLMRLIQDVLDVSATALGRFELRRERLDLGALVAEVAGRVPSLTERHRVTVSAIAGVIVEADRDRIEQVLMNLLMNAIRYSPHQGVVAVTVDACGPEATVSVQDQGLGIPAERQARIFELFYRAHDGADRDRQGMGVGLHLSRQVIERHGGRLTFVSAEGQGSTFWFSLPLAEPAPAPLS